MLCLAHWYTQHSSTTTIAINTIAPPKPPDMPMITASGRGAEEEGRGREEKGGGRRGREEKGGGRRGLYHI